MLSVSACTCACMHGHLHARGGSVESREDADAEGTCDLGWVGDDVLKRREEAVASLHTGVNSRAADGASHECTSGLCCARKKCHICSCWPGATNSIIMPAQVYQAKCLQHIYWPATAWGACVHSLAARAATIHKVHHHVGKCSQGKVLGTCMPCLQHPGLHVCIRCRDVAVRQTRSSCQQMLTGQGADSIYLLCLQPPALYVCIRSGPYSKQHHRPCKHSKVHCLQHIMGLLLPGICREHACMHGIRSCHTCAQVCGDRGAGSHVCGSGPSAAGHGSIRGPAPQVGGLSGPGR